MEHFGYTVHSTRIQSSVVSLTPFLIFVDSLALLVRDGPALLGVRGLTLLLRHGDALVLTLLVTGTTVLPGPGCWERALNMGH